MLAHVQKGSREVVSAHNSGNGTLFFTFLLARGRVMLGSVATLKILSCSCSERIAWTNHRTNPWKGSIIHFLTKKDGSTVKVTCSEGNKRTRFRVGVFSEFVAFLGLRLLSNQIVFVECDKSIVEFPRVVSSRGCAQLRFTEIFGTFYDLQFTTCRPQVTALICTPKTPFTKSYDILGRKIL